MKNEVAQIIQDILNERARQDAEFGTLPRNLKPTFYLPILTEELGEVARSIIDGDSLGYRQELIQLAAVAIAAVEEFDSGNATGHLELVCHPNIKYQAELDGRDPV
jgi:NTP pyrophosphatase (non-canonical NTP hydrolase)